MRAAMALKRSRKKDLGWISRKLQPWPLESLSSSSSYRHILGPDLPDIWIPPPPPPLPSLNQDSTKLIPTIIDGKSIAEEIRAVISEEVRQMKDAINKVPGLAVVLVGQKLPPSQSPLVARRTFEDNTKLIPTIIDGKSIAEEIRAVISEEVRQMKDAINKVPGLAVVLVGQRRDSETYVRNKTKACQEVGIASLLAELSEDCREEDIVNAVTSFNRDPSVHGILVQLPLPKHMDEEKILGAISLEKDVDGFHPMNVGNLALRGREPLFIPCAAKACIELLIRSGVELRGTNVAVIGRSKVVGLPTSLLLQRHHATVSNIHAFTKNPEDITREADVVISAAGVPNLVRRSWLKRGAIVIDVGTNPVEDPSSEHGYYLTGDVCYEEALQVVSAITPVPGGVGPVTIAMLLSNTLESAKRAYGFS